VNSQVYIEKREAILETLIEKLPAQEQFIAAWLTGSYASQQQDRLSDIDLTVVVADEYCSELCTRPWMKGAQTTPERAAVFSLFGKLAFLHENHHNAPTSGTFTFVAYAKSGILVDWILRPLSGASRPADSRLLFDRAGIPVHAPVEPESQQQRASQASEMVAFFWMMVAVTVKYVHRGDGVFVNTWLKELTGLVHAVERLLAGQVWAYQHGSTTALKITPAEQLEALRQLCAHMQRLMPAVAESGGYVAEAPMTVIEMLMDLAQENSASDEGDIVLTPDSEEI
jgi:hypothetical protein